MSFFPKRNHPRPEDLLQVTIANSTTVAVGEAVALASDGFLTNGAAAAPLLGIVVGFCAHDGTPLSPTEYSAGTATGTDVQTVTSASDNETSAKKRAIVNISKRTIYSADVSGTLGTTNNSPSTTYPDRVGGMVDVNSAGSSYSEVLETTHSRTAGTCCNFFVWGLDQEDTGNLLVSIASSWLDAEQS